MKIKGQRKRIRKRIMPLQVAVEIVAGGFNKVVYTTHGIAMTPLHFVSGKRKVAMLAQDTITGKIERIALDTVAIAHVMLEQHAEAE